MVSLNKIKVLLALLLIGLLLGVGFYAGYRVSSVLRPAQKVEQVPERIVYEREVELEVSDRQIKAKVNGKVYKTLKSPRESISIKVPRKGDLQLEVKSEPLFPLRPILGLQLSKSLHPALGIKLVKIEKLGLSADISAPGISMSLSYDLSDYSYIGNSFVLLFHRWNFNGGTNVGIGFGTYL